MGCRLKGSEETRRGIEERRLAGMGVTREELPRGGSGSQPLDGSGGCDLV